MADSQLTEDEFDTLPDVFAGVDWDAVPDMNANVPAAIGDNIEDGFDDLPDQYAGVNWDSVPNLGTVGSQADAPATSAPSTQTHEQVSEQDSQSSPSFRPSSAHSSSEYSFDDVDDSFFEEVDALEANLTQQPARDTGALTPPLLVVPSNLTVSSLYELPVLDSGRILSTPRSQTNIPDNTARNTHSSPTKTPTKRRRQAHTPLDSPSPKRKSKGKGREDIDPNAGVRQVLADFEDELTCPICCDIFAAAHLGNPCGHSFCGDCGWGWIFKNKRSPTCAICRTRLIASAPMIPNFAMDNTVEKHITALAASGSVDWQPHGSRYKEWTQRKEKWKADAAKRTAEARRAPPAPAYRPISASEYINLMNSYEALDDEYVDVNDEDNDESSEDEGESDLEDEEVNVPPPLPPPPLPPVVPATLSISISAPPAPTAIRGQPLRVAGASNRGGGRVQRVNGGANGGRGGGRRRGGATRGQNRGGHGNARRGRGGGRGGRGWRGDYNL